jgi:hypothetical protein
MFHLTANDLIRLSFGQVLRSYMAQARAAERLTAFAWSAKVFTLTALGVATAASIVAILAPRRPLHITVAICVGLAFATYAIVLALDVEPRVQAHKASANRLWLLAERYRSLLAEIHDGLADHDQIQQRRDELLHEVHSAYEHAPLAGRHKEKDLGPDVDPAGAHEGLTDEQIDRFLPAALRKGSAAAGTPARATISPS